MDVKQLYYFSKVYENGSFSKAASNCYISVQGINAAIIKLEKEMEQKLFIRAHNGIAATPAGEFLYEKTQKILQTIKECEIYFQKDLVGKQLLYISFVAELFHALPPKASSLLSNSFKQPIVLKSGGALTCEEDVVNNLSTFAIVNVPKEIQRFKNPRLAYEYCFSKERVLVVNRNNPLAKKKNLLMKDLGDCKFIMVNSHFKTYHEFIEICNKNGFKPNIDFQIETLSTTYNLLKNNEDLIGISFDFYLNQHADPQITQLHIADLKWSWDIYLAYMKDANLNENERVFKKAFIEIFEQQRQ